MFSLKKLFCSRPGRRQPRSSNPTFHRTSVNVLRHSARLSNLPRNNNNESESQTTNGRTWNPDKGYARQETVDSARLPSPIRLLPWDQISHQQGWISDFRTCENGNDGRLRIAPVLPLLLFRKPFSTSPFTSSVLVLFPLHFAIERLKAADVPPEAS